MGPSKQTIKTEAARFATTIRDGGPQDAHIMLNRLGESTTGGDPREIAEEANIALKEAGLGDRYLVSGYSDGSLRLTRTEAVPNSLRQEAKLNFYSPGEAPNAPNKTPSADRLGEEARRFTEEIAQSGTPEQTLRECLDELKKMGADFTDVARPLNQALKQNGLDMSILANSSGEVVLNSYRTKSEVIAETIVASSPGETAGTESTTSGDTYSVTSLEQSDVGMAPEEERRDDEENVDEDALALHLINTALVKEQVMNALRRLAGPDRARFLAVNGILPDTARARPTSDEDGQQVTEQPTANGSSHSGDAVQDIPVPQAESAKNPGSALSTEGMQSTEGARSADSLHTPEHANQKAQKGDQLSGHANDQQQAQTPPDSEGRLERSFQKDGATIGVLKVNGKEVTISVVRPDGSRTIYGNHDDNGNPGSIEEYNPGAHEPFRTATRGDNNMWTTIQGGKEFQKQGHLTVDNGIHRFQTADGTTFVRMPDGKASLEVAPAPDRVEEREGAVIEFRNISSKEVTSAITYPNGFKAVYGGHDTDGNPTSIKEYAKDSKQPFRTAKLNGDTWKIESPGRPPIELKGTLTVQNGIQTFDTAEAKFMRTASGSEKIEAKSRT